MTENLRFLSAEAGASQSIPSKKKARTNCANPKQHLGHGISKRFAWFTKKSYINMYFNLVLGTSVLVKMTSINLLWINKNIWNILDHHISLNVYNISININKQPHESCFLHFLGPDFRPFCSTRVKLSVSKDGFAMTGRHRWRLSDPMARCPQVTQAANNFTRSHVGLVYLLKKNHGWLIFWW